MIKKQWLKYTTYTLASITILYLLFYIALIIITYTPLYYNTQISKDAQIHTDNLQHFFLYKEQLTNNWTPKETQHMKDVRHLFNITHIATIILCIITSISLVLFKQKYKIKITQKKFTHTLSKIILIITPIILIIALLIITTFQKFWTAIHPFLFSNNYWLMYPNDLSYSLFPQTFFSNIAIILILLYILLLIASIITFNITNTKNTKNTKENSK